jgi:hypothetical protein
MRQINKILYIHFRSKNCLACLRQIVDWIIKVREEGNKSEGAGGFMSLNYEKS